MGHSDIYLNALEMVDHHIAEGRRHIAEQRRRILQLMAEGEDAAFEHKLMATFIYSLTVHEIRREVLLYRLAIR